MAGAQSADRTLVVYRRLERRNRFVSVLRIAVPALGLLVLVGLLGQIYLSSLGGRYGVGRIEVTPDAVSVEAPEYAGVFDDGSAYRVWADSARAGLDNSEIIDLSNAYLTINRTSGVEMNIDAEDAILDTNQQTVLIKGLANVTDSTGTRATLFGSTFHGATQILNADGPVDITYADGAKVKAGKMVYDGNAMIWTFSQAVVTLPDTPGQSSPENRP